MKPTTSIALSVVCAAGLGSTILADAAAARTKATTLCSSQINIASTLPGGANEDPDVIAVNRFIDETFAAALDQLRTASPPDPYHQLVLLGTLGLYDKNLSVNKNVACTTCHFEGAGFTGGVSLFNETIVGQPGSVPITNATPPGPNYRIASRKPQTYGYAPFAPMLEFNATQQDFYGGNFWDMRATGNRLGNPAAEQALGPPVNPLEMALPDTACAVYRVSQSEYKGLFEKVWGAQSFDIDWPDDVETVCSTPGPPPANDPLPVDLSPEDRGTSNSTYDHLAQSMASYEGSPGVSPFSSKFDFALANPTERVLTRDERAGWDLFRGKGTCNSCHLDGTEAGKSGGKRGKGIKPTNATNVAPCSLISPRPI